MTIEQEKIYDPEIPTGSASIARNRPAGSRSWNGPCHAHCGRHTPGPWALFWFALSAPFILLGLRTLRLRSAQEPQYKALVGLVGAGVFVISAMPVPVFTAGTCSHPCGTGIAAILIGPSVTVVLASIALTLACAFSRARRLDHIGSEHSDHGSSRFLCGLWNLCCG